MFFCICEHYDDNQPIIKENYNECFICFEYKIDSEMEPINLLSQKFYLNNCACNASVHNYCLKIWIDKHKSCPICRTCIIERSNTAIIIFNYIPYGIKIYAFIKNLSIRFIKLLSVILFLYAIIDFSIDMMRIKYIPLNDEYYEYIPIPILEDKYFNQST